MTSRRNRYIVLASATYATLGLAWIQLSDQFLSHFGSLGDAIWVSTLKGAFFVLATTAAIVVMLRAMPADDHEERSEHPDLIPYRIQNGWRGAWLNLGLVTMISLATLGVQGALQAALGTEPLETLLFFPVVLGALLGGFAVSMAALALMASATAYHFMAPRGSFLVLDHGDQIELLFFIIAGLGIAALCAGLRSAKMRSDRFNQLFYAVLDGTTDAVFVKGSDGRYLLANEATARFLGKERRQILGKTDPQLFPDAAATALAGIDASVMREGTTRTQEETLLMPDGEQMTFLVTKGPLRDPKGRIYGIFGISRDISARKRGELRLRDSEAFNQAILDSVSAEIAVLDRDGTIVATNRSWRSFAQENSPDPALPVPGTTVGANYLHAIKDARGFSSEGARDAYEGIVRVTSGRIEAFTLEYSCHSVDRQRWFSMTVTPLMTGQGGAVVAHTDITSLKHAEQALRESEAQLREAQRMAKIGNWTLDLKTGKGTWSAEMARIHDLPAGQAPGFDVVRDRYAESSWANIEAAMKEATDHGTPYRFDAELRLPSGAPRWVVGTGEAVRDASGEVAQLRGIVQDITDRKQVELALRETQHLARLGGWSWDIDSGQHVWSEEIYRTYGRDPGLPAAEYPEVRRYFTEESWLTLSAAVERCLREGLEYECDAEVRRTDGSRRWIIARGRPVRDAGGRIVRIEGTVQDITARKQSELRLAESEWALREAQRLAMIGNWSWQPGDDAPRWSDVLYDIYGRDRALGPIRRADFPSHYTRESWARLGPLVERCLAGGGGYECDVEVLHPDGGRRWVVTRGSCTHDQAGKPIGIHGTIQDITQRKLAEAELRKLAQAVEQSPSSIVITDLAGNIEYVNSAFARISGYDPGELAGNNSRMLQSGKTPRETYESLWRALGEGRTWEGEFHNRRKDGSDYLEHAIVSIVRNDDGSPGQYLAVKEDITEKRRNEVEIHRLAYYDPLTALPNRAMLLDRVGQALVLAQRSDHFGALLLFNLDRFKTVNDAGGQALGDSLLRQVAERLSQGLREADVVARVVGDEFGILLTDLSSHKQGSANQALHVAEKIQAGLGAIFSLEGESITLTASLGIALFPDDAEDAPLDILRRANTALHHAKDQGGNLTAFFEAGIDEMAKKTFSIEHDLRQGIGAGELRVYLQPQVDAAGRQVAAEALVRWQHPKRGLLPPGVFIPIAEESTLIIELGTWVLSEVCRMLARENALISPMRVAVNISPRHFRQPGFADQVKKVLAETGADPMRLTLEVTEGMLIDNVNDVVAKMNQLTAIGIHFSLDDFGTGYSSLAYLKRLPIDELKIDRTFVQDMTTDDDDASLVEAILSIAEHLHLQVVAEGVESAEQAAFLNQRGKVLHQGFFFGRPEPVEDWLRRLGRAENRAGAGAA